MIMNTKNLDILLLNPLNGINVQNISQFLYIKYSIGYYLGDKKEKIIDLSSSNKNMVNI